MGTWTHECGVEVMWSNWRHPQYRWCVDQDGCMGQVWQEHLQVTRRVWGQGLRLLLDTWMGVVGFTKTHEGE